MCPPILHQGLPPTRWLSHSSLHGCQLVLLSCSKELKYEHAKVMVKVILSLNSSKSFSLQLSPNWSLKTTPLLQVDLSIVSCIRPNCNAKFCTMRWFDRWSSDRNNCATANCTTDVRTRGYNQDVRGLGGIWTCDNQASEMTHYSTDSQEHTIKKIFIIRVSIIVASSFPFIYKIRHASDDIKEK